MFHEILYASIVTLRSVDATLTSLTEFFDLFLHLPSPRHLWFGDLLQLRENLMIYFLAQYFYTSLENILISLLFVPSGYSLHNFLHNLVYPLFISRRLFLMPINSAPSIA